MRLRALAVALCGPLLCNQPAGAAEQGIPNFAPEGYTGWRGAGTMFIPAPSGPQPVAEDKAYPRTPSRPDRVADITNPNLLPWVVDVLRRNNETILSGKPYQPSSASCQPLGVLVFHVQQSLPVFIIQGAHDVVMVQEENNQVRHIFPAQQHSPHPKPSWFGESVGHYENGDTLVVDTIGLNDKTFADRFGTPHTTALHVTERWKLMDGGKAIDVNVRVEDPGAIKSPYEVTRHYRAVEPGSLPFRSSGTLEEQVCAENANPFFDQGFELPVPQAATPDF